jgi:hypothetical protein
LEASNKRLSADKASIVSKYRRELNEYKATIDHQAREVESESL